MYMHATKFAHIFCLLLCGLTLAIAGPFSIFAAEREPPIRTGLWLTQRISEDPAALEVFANSIRANHQLTGVCLHVPWNEVEKEAGNPISARSISSSPRREDTGMMTYDLVQKYRDRAHHGFQSLASLAHGSERMGSIEMAVLNVVHAQGEYWELWHGDGLSVATCTAVARAWEEGRRLGYDAYKKKLISEGEYRPRDEDHYRAKDRGRGNSAQTSAD
jgi:hypothetical protein